MAGSVDAAGDSLVYPVTTSRDPSSELLALVREVSGLSEQVKNLVSVVGRQNTDYKAILDDAKRQDQRIWEVEEVQSIMGGRLNRLEGSIEQIKKLLETQTASNEKRLRDLEDRETVRSALLRVGNQALLLIGGAVVMGITALSTLFWLWADRMFPWWP